jgi:hypothetical protein
MESFSKPGRACKRGWHGLEGGSIQRFNLPLPPPSCPVPVVLQMPEAALTNGPRHNNARRAVGVDRQALSHSGPRFMEPNPITAATLRPRR